MGSKRFFSILGVSSLLFLGCSKGEDILHTEKIKLDNLEFVVEVRPLDETGKRLWIYDCGVDRNKSRWAGVSFALDKDGDCKIDALKGPLLGYVTDKDTTRPNNTYAIVINTVNNDSLSNKLNRVLRNLETKSY